MDERERENRGDHMKGNVKKYLIYDGDVLIGEMTGAEAGERFGVSKNRCAQYALSGTRLKGKYTVKYADPDQSPKRPKIARETFWQEWEEATAAVKEEISVEMILLKYWEKTVRPIRRKHWLWKS